MGKLRKQVKRAMNHLLKLICVLLFIGMCNATAFADYEESLGQQAEAAGKYREALTHYVNAIQPASEGSPKDQELREKIIKLVQKIQPPPAVPEEARRHMLRGEAAVDAARDKGGFLRAADEFGKALLLAPWLAEGYYNLGVVCDKAGLYEEAIRALNMYLMAKPNAGDAKQVHDLIYKIEYRIEEAKRLAEEENKKALAAKQQENEKAKKLIRNLAGIWGYKQANWTEFYELIVTGEDSFTLKYKYYTKTSNFPGNPFPHKDEFSLKVNGDNMSGYRTLWIDFQSSGFNCSVPEKTFPVSGMLSDPGNSIVIITNHPMAFTNPCGWTTPAAERRITFSRSP